ncbi:uncharacterized protein si:dkey-205h13.2 isoform X3 [Cyclopterus lumpus]|uniref:uncharacterized protein si:dkey-205h13.2 isoform X3 n=1 Tax=Cyclopterus lumpus TaxID=8103 RepID=UPI001486AA9A|nr:uncharacterized protein si:dkey-205h13.2 isoform X3 [Cyclopterus lumpus]
MILHHFQSGNTEHIATSTSCTVYSTRHLQPAMPKRKCKFTDELEKKYSSFRLNRDASEAECMTCRAGTYVSVAHKGGSDLEAHVHSAKHKTAARGESSSSKVTDFFCRTRWFDHDDPTGNGDFEVLTDLRSIYPRDICPQPIAIEVQTISGEPVSSTSNTFLYYDATYGFACVNADQRSKSCEDYKVRFTCLNEFCQVSAQCRTQWLNSDAPSDEGDVESIFQLLKTFPGQVCRNPISIEAKSTSGISAEHTGDTFLSYDVTFGFACINGKQSGKQCKDYQVILTCPSDFCQGCRTRWFNMDNPASRGDYETLLQLQMLYPSEVCSKPVAIEAMTVSNVPAHKTGDVFQIYDASLGFACVNAEQPGGKRCQDYKVRLTCPLAFCSV